MRIKRFCLRLLMLFIILGLLGVIGVAGVIMYFAQDLPPYTNMADYKPAQVTTIYANDGTAIAQLYQEKRYVVPLGQIPLHVQQGFLAAEDASFYKHSGVSPKAVLRAAYDNLAGNPTGGSTITQQLVKNLLLSSERKITRKIKEAILAYRIESYLTKDEILNLYLNHIYLGSGAYGVEAAARVYFGKHVEDLTIAESAVIAGLPPAPNGYSPYTSQEKAYGRQRYVLGRMLELGYITKDEYDEARSEKLTFNRMKEPDWLSGGWVAEEVRVKLGKMLSEEELNQNGIYMDRYGLDALYNSGLKIYTTVDPVHQREATVALRAGLYDHGKYQGWNGLLGHYDEALLPAYKVAMQFSPILLDDAGWVKAVITDLTDKQATVHLGYGPDGKEYTGGIDGKHFIFFNRWNNNPKPNALLQVGDVVYVSAVGAKGTKNPVGAPAQGKIKEYDSSTITGESPLVLCLEQIPKGEGAVVSIEPGTGDVVALVGGYEYKAQGQFNRATQAKRQPGSAFKPVVYSAALDHGFTAGSVVYDVPFVIDDGTGKPWLPDNSNQQFEGPMLFRTALVKSKNLVTIRLVDRVGIPDVIKRAKELGIEGDFDPVMAMALGTHVTTPLNMTEAYTAFANEGTLSRARLITKITDNNDNVLFNFVPENSTAISKENAYIMASILKDVAKNGTAYKVGAAMKNPVGGKTGTTNEARDAWFIGLTPFLVTSVYVGNDDNTPLGRRAYGGTVALPVFIDYRKAVEDLYPPDDFRKPEDIIFKRIDTENGLLSGPYTKSALNLPFVKGTEPTVSGGKSDTGGATGGTDAEELFMQ